MPQPGYKSVTVPEEAYELARQLADLGLEGSIGEAFATAIEEYVRRRKAMMDELLAVKKKWSQIEAGPS